MATPSAVVFDEAFADDNGGVKFLKIDRSVISEKNGKRNPYKPFNKNKLIYLTTEEVGAFVWATLAEKTNPVEGVVYTTVGNYKLISRYRTTDPLTETTAGQALCLPVIENVDQIYYQDITEAQVVDETAEAADTDDVKITVWGTAYKKPQFIAALKAMGVSVATNATDATVINKVNMLDDKQEAELKEAVSTAKA